MRYNSYRGTYLRKGKGIYTCQLCGETVMGSYRMRHIGKHIQNNTFRVLY